MSEVRATKALGQHFLVDLNIARKICDALSGGVRPGTSAGESAPADMAGNAGAGADTRVGTDGCADAGVGSLNGGGAGLAAGADARIAADTTVVLDGAIVGKPADPVDASNILSRMQGQRHEVLTGIAVLLDRGDSASTVWASDRSEVTIRPMSSGEVAWYVATGEPLDKAGAYGLQGIGAAFVEKVVGTPTNVIGLPVPLLFGLIDRAGLRWRHTA